MIEDLSVQELLGNFSIISAFLSYFDENNSKFFKKASKRSHLRVKIIYKSCIINGLLGIR